MSLAMPDSASPMELIRDLIRDFGLVIGGKDLMRLLGYRTYKSFSSACARHALPVPVFEIEGRKGKFARTADVVDWYVKLHP